MKGPFHLVRTDGSSDTAACVRALMRDVRNKRLLGLAFVAIYEQRNYEAHLCGEAERSPTFARGAVMALDDKLRTLIHGGGDGAPLD